MQGSNMVQEGAADAVIAFLQTLEDNNNQDEIQLEILNSVSRLEQAFMMSVTNEDLDRFVNHTLKACILYNMFFFITELLITVEYLQS